MWGFVSFGLGRWKGSLFALCSVCFAEYRDQETAIVALADDDIELLLFAAFTGVFNAATRPWVYRGTAGSTSLIALARFNVQWGSWAISFWRWSHLL